MHKNGVKNFPYYVGINSLEEIATKEDRVCVLNILGTESRQVTPVSHSFSGGNIVFGTSPGKTGQNLETKLGAIPVYNSVREGMEAGHRFNTGVIYLPPAAVKDGVSELIRQNKELKKIFILTEKVSVKDSRTIRAICQVNGIDIFGANCLGVGDAWSQVRLGGALGGSDPEESLVKGSIALYSNSGNFTTTISVYLMTQGWGTTTSISSGKDVYIHFSPHEFFYALNQDDRSKGAIIYVEPGGYYEHNLTIGKPTIACVVGRWKAGLTRSCGHAGSLAGSGDDAAAKERWFMNYFGVNSIFTPENPVVSERGAVVTNISHIPEALTQVMALNKVKPDFEPKGNLSLKCWFGNNQRLPLPVELDLPIMDALPPYGDQINVLNKQVGIHFPRQNLKDASGASMMDTKTHVSKIHNLSILEASKRSYVENLIYSLIKSYPNPSERDLANTALNAFVNMVDDPALIAAEAARESESSPNCVIMSALGILGKGRVKNARNAANVLLELFQHKGIQDGSDHYDYANILKSISPEQKKVFTGKNDRLAIGMLSAINKKGVRGCFIDFVLDASDQEPSHDAILAAIWVTIGWSALMEKKISQITFLNLPWYSRVFSCIIGSAVSKKHHQENSFYGIDQHELMENWSFSETAFLSLVGRKPSINEQMEFNVLMGMLITNGPGTISAQGCKGAVSADGPEAPDKVQINKAFMAFLSHTGFAHGGNGFEAMAFLIQQFQDTHLITPGDAGHGIDLKKMTQRYARWYDEYKKREKKYGNADYKKIPCINHPVFKGKDLNVDPRTKFVSKVLEEKNSYNIFLDFYENLVVSLREEKVTPNVYCVNVDAVIAVILLKILWGTLKEDRITPLEVENAAFNAFLFGRMIGCGAEIDDHINRGRNMDTRTPTSRCKYVG